VANLRSDYVNLVNNKVYQQFMAAIEDRRNHYMGELRANPKVGDTATMGALWQILVKVLDSMLEAPARIANGDTTE
jgi:hypothetical protein